MGEQIEEQYLSEILKAVGDATRRSLLTTLVQEGATRVTDLATHYDLSLNAVSKHIKVLENAHLVNRRTLGRVHLIEANLAPIRQVEGWFENLKSIWELRLELLNTALQKGIPEMSDLTLAVKKTISAPIEAVFDAWLDPKMLMQFMAPSEGMHAPKAETDPREGGRFSIIMATAEQEIPHSGTYLELKPHSRLVFTWESPFSAEGSFVTIHLSKLSKSMTEIELIHKKFADESARENHKKGWTGILDALAAVLESSS